MPDLDRYRRKRDPERTPEPFGEQKSTALPAGARRRFVVQQHAATRMHWDLRLEIDGVLVSWAVPRGPSLHPREKRLAVQTEDHPLEYATFEGNIPANNYGAGAMILWDTGAYYPVDGVSPLEGLEAGKLDIVLQGYKLHGRFALVRTGKPAPNSWLLLRKGAAPRDDTEIVERLDRSIYSGLTVAELAEHVSRSAAVTRVLDTTSAVRPEPTSLGTEPMLAVTVDPTWSLDRPGWLFELKYDGFRVRATKAADGEVRIVSRNGVDYTSLVPELCLALRHLAVESGVLDGEMVALDDAGRPDFEALAQRLADHRRWPAGRADLETPLYLLAFDLLAVDGRNITHYPLVARKAALSQFVGSVGPIRYVDHLEENGQALFEAAAQAGLEGIMAKRADSPYRNTRSEDWCKVKRTYTVDVVIVGLEPGHGARERLGAVAGAWWVDDKLVYAGHVGSGLDETTVATLLERTAPLHRVRPSCEELPPSARGVHLDPVLVAEVRCTGITRTGRMRHPVFLRLRSDKSPAECRLDPTLVVRSASRDVRPTSTITPVPAADETQAPIAPSPSPRTEHTTTTGPHTARLDKVFWPAGSHTKGDLLDYYTAIWPWLGPYLHDRPLVVERFPDGVTGKRFFQRRAPDFLPAWIPRAQSGGIEHVVCNDLDTLRYIVGLAAIVLHIEHARFSDPEHPDWIVLDLDPKAAPFAQVVHVARHVHRLLTDLDTPHTVKTSGRSGLHILVPLDGHLDHEQARALAEVLAKTVNAELPDLTTITRPIAARGDRVYLDYLQNGAGKLIVAPFSVRAEPSPTVSAPLRWGQVTSRLHPEQWTIASAPSKFQRHGDPMAALLTAHADVPRLLDALAVRLARASR